MPIDDLNLLHQEKRHQPLALLSGRLYKQQLQWCTLEREAYVVLATLERMHWLVATSAGFDLCTDHNNFIFLFDRISVIPDLSQSTLRKVFCCAVHLTLYKYTCFYIKAEYNVWADLLSR